MRVYWCEDGCGETVLAESRADAVDLGWLRVTVHNLGVGVPCDHLFHDWRCMTIWCARQDHRPELAMAG